MGMTDQKIPPSYKKTEDWEVKKLGKVCKYQNGATLEKYINYKMNMNKGLKSI